MAGKNRLNLVIDQNLAAFADGLQLSPEQASQWHKIVGMIDSLKPSKVYGIKLKLEEETIVVMPTFEFQYDLQKLVNGSNSALLKAATMFTPKSSSTPLLLGWPLVFSGCTDVFLQPLDEAQKLRGWEIIFGAVVSLAKMGTQELTAIANLSNNVVQSLSEANNFDMGSLPTLSFLQGVPNGELLSPSAQGATFFHHKGLLNDPLKRSFRVAVPT